MTDQVMFMVLEMSVSVGTVVVMPSMFEVIQTLTRRLRKWQEGLCGKRRPSENVRGKFVATEAFAAKMEGTSSCVMPPCVEGSILSQLDLISA